MRHTVGVAASNRGRVVQMGEPAALAASGVLVLATGRLPWVSEGAGSTLDGLELADSLRHGALVPDAGRWVAMGLYLLVALGGLLLASSGFSGPLVASIRLGGALTVSAAFVAAALAGWFPPSRWSFGPTLVLAASTIAVAVSGAQLLRRRETDSNNYR